MANKLSHYIDTFNKKQGDYTSLVIIPLLAIVLYEVMMRYVFNAPTIWGFEATTFAYGLHYMFGLSYTDVYDGHVKVDIFTNLLPKKLQAVMGIITLLILFFPVITCLTIWSFKFALTSLSNMEVNSTSWAPPIYPFKIIMAFTLFFLWLQGVSNLFKQFDALKN